VNESVHVCVCVCERESESVGFRFLAEIVVFGTEKVEILQYYLMPCRVVSTV